MSTERNAANTIEARVVARGPREEPDTAEEALSPQARADAQKRSALLANVRQDYRVDGGLWYFRARPDVLAFKEAGIKLVTSHNSPEVAFSMTALAQAKGWSAITASGHPDFRREVWMEARLRGIGVLGYEPSEQDQEGLASRLERTMRHVATRGEASAGATLSPRNSERGGAEEKRDVIKAVAAALVESRLQDPALVERVLKCVEKRLDERAAEGREPPTVLFYDKAAPTRHREQVQPAEHFARSR